MKSSIQDYLEELHKRYRDEKSGKVADYIPELFKANPDWFGICIATTDGQVYAAGDTEQLFTIQSISKPFVYGIALEDNGRDAVLAKVGVEPTGDAFNSISLDPVTGQPANPMINAGAIATSNLVHGSSSQKKMARILDAFSRYVGHDLAIDEAVYQSEAETGHRNRAISHLLRNFNIIESDPGPGLDAYFRQCSINVTCRDLAIMAATLANNGINPCTGKRAIMAEYVENILGVMSSCGMYDYAGEWIYRVGLPAKSGVGGGILAVLPGQLGIGIFSPPLDSLGNSVRGIKVCEDLSRDLHLHMLRVPNTTSSVVRRTFDCAHVNSNRLRPDSEMKILRKEGNAIRILELQGELVFSSMEKAVREALDLLGQTSILIINFRHVQSMNVVAARMLLDLWKMFQSNGRHLVLAELKHLANVPRFFSSNLTPELFAQVRFSDDLDASMEWAENQILKNHGRIKAQDQQVPPEKYNLLADFSPEEMKQIKSLLQPKTFKENELVLTAGDTSAELYFLKRGKVSIIIQKDDQQSHRLATYSPGMAFGEVAFLDRAPRSASVRADTYIECDVLSAEKFDSLISTNPQLAVKLLRNIALEFSQILRRNNRALQLYSR